MNTRVTALSLVLALAAGWSVPAAAQTESDPGAVCNEGLYIQRSASQALTGAAPSERDKSAKKQRQPYNYYAPVPAEKAKAKPVARAAARPAGGPGISPLTLAIVGAAAAIMVSAAAAAAIVILRRRRRRRRPALALALASDIRGKPPRQAIPGERGKDTATRRAA
jgi:hypothetical protein